MYYGIHAALLIRPTTIMNLLQWGSPTTILWRVRAVIINAVNAVLRRWLLPHIGQECLIRLQPSLVNGDSATTIARIFRRVWVQAARPHGFPRPIFRRVLVVSARAMCRQRLLRSIAAKTATAHGVAEIQRRNSRCANAAADAATDGEVAARPALHCFYRQASKCASDECLSLRVRPCCHQQILSPAVWGC